ncbi:hypothetical protein T190130A13A_20067 [Tenacibaculum sp. 190130A14a]|uniref:Uncharacterized protein n=1 Tax=Tenacibaculum polynesiense TaxID=3137857 RepID=A0ABM9PA48_9FLAO
MIIKVFSYISNSLTMQIYNILQYKQTKVLLILYFVSILTYYGNFRKNNGN